MADESTAHNTEDGQSQSSAMTSQAPGAADAAEEATALPKADFRVLQGARVLIVEDSLAVRKFLAATLKGANAQVTETENGQIAMTALSVAQGQKRPFNLVLTDINMPVMTGCELVHAIRSDAAIKSTPVIVFSTESERSMVMRCAQMGISGYVIKPCPAPRILEAAANALSMAVQPAAPEAGGNETGGLAASQIKLLRSVVLKSAEQAIKEGKTTAQKAEEEPVAKAVLAFLGSFCGEGQ
mgnify:CR=1 FL=1